MSLFLWFSTEPAERTVGKGTLSGVRDVLRKEPKEMRGDEGGIPVRHRAGSCLPAVLRVAAGSEQQHSRPCSAPLARAHSTAG